jgi:hypothetical protein
MTTGFAPTDVSPSPEISGPGVFFAFAHDDVHGLFRLTDKGPIPIGNGGGSGGVTLTVSEIPEPTTFALVCLGLGAIAGTSFRSRRILVKLSKT